LENGKAVLNIRYRDNKIPMVRITAMLHAALSYLKGNLVSRKVN